MLPTQVLIVMLGVLGCVMAYENGPPVQLDGICQTMTPSRSEHGADPSTDPSPFKVTWEGDFDCYNSSTKHTVTVMVKGSGEDGYDADAKIEGLFVQAKKEPQGDKNYGTFTESESDLKLLTCFEEDESAVGHNKELDDQSMSMMWTYDGDSEHTLNFYATVVYHKDTFWVDLKSPDLPRCGASALASVGLLAPLCLLLAVIMRT